MKITIRTITLILARLLGSISYGVQASCKSDSGAQKREQSGAQPGFTFLSSETTGSQNLSLSSGTFSCTGEWIGYANRVAIISEMANSTAYINYGNYVLQFTIGNIVPTKKTIVALEKVIFPVLR